MIEGMPAKSSIALLRMEETVPFLKYYPRKIEIEREKGSEMRRERKDVRRVPTRKGRAPNSPNTGSHVFPNKKLVPNALSEGSESTVKVMKIETSRITIQRAEKLSTPKKTVSEVCVSLECSADSFLAAVCGIKIL